MAFRSVKEFLTLEGSKAPTPAESRVIAAVQAGELCVLGKTVPMTDSPDNAVRADLLRLLITGGTSERGAQDHGVWVEGAWITGVLDLGFAKARGQTVLRACRFAEAPVFIEGRLTHLSLDDSHLPGMSAEGMRVVGNLSMKSVTSKGTVNLARARIGGFLNCSKASFESPDGKAIKITGAKIGQSLVLEQVTAKGIVDVSRAKIGGYLELSRAHLNGNGRMSLNALGVETGQSIVLSNTISIGKIDIASARIGGYLNCDNAEFGAKEDAAVKAEGMSVVRGLTWRGAAVRSGWISLAGSKVGDLADDMSWPLSSNSLRLDGFVYDRIGGNTSPLTAAERRDWLRAGSLWKGRFYPQPYTQLACVFRAMGLGGEARTVLYWREQEVFAQVRRDLLVAPVGRQDMVFGHLGREVRAAALLLGDWVLRIVAGYGYRPLRALRCLIVLWAVAAALAWQVWHEGSFAPNSDVVLVSEGWQQAEQADCIPRVPDAIHTVCDPNPAAAWSNDPARGLDWDSFSPFGYALDLVVPVLDLGQTDAWAPSKDRSWWGWGLWWGRWVLIAAGWIVTAIGAAAVTGIMQKERE